MLWVYFTVESKPPSGYEGVNVEHQLKVSKHVENVQEAAELIEAAMIEVERVFGEE